jgi:hypothetical protein
MATLLWILAVILVVVGILKLIRGELILGIVLVILGVIIGPGGGLLVGALGAPLLPALLL